jgi:imidazolonepropionase-like amidohydrolase
MAIRVLCGSLFTGREDMARPNCTLVIDASGKVVYAGPAPEAPRRGPQDVEFDYSGLFVMPGLIDVHTHLAYGNAKSKEDIDLYQPLEFRAIRGLYFAQSVLGAGYTSICAPGDAGQIALSVRNAIKAGLFVGPRVMAGGRYLTNNQGFQDSYPSWIGVPETAIATMVRNNDEAIAEIRRQVKDGVDCVKLDLDGIQLRPNGEIIASFTQAETTAMVEEIHRLGRKAVAHARGREAVLYAARAGVDLIFHAAYIDDECIEALVRSGSAIGPTLTFPRNTVDFTLPSEPAFKKGRVIAERRELEIACENLRKAKKAGVPLMTGTDSGFAVTPYGEWHARELELFVECLGFTPAEALRAATEVSARFIEADRVGVLEPGRLGDFIAVDGSPIENVSILLDKRRIRAVHLGGAPVTIPERRNDYDPRQVSDRAWVSWTELYTQERVAALRAEGGALVAAQ